MDELKRRQVVDDLSRARWGGGSANSAVAALRAAGLGHQRSVVLEVVRGAPAIEYSREVGQEIAELEAEAGRLEAELVVVRRRLLALRRFDSQ